MRGGSFCAELYDTDISLCAKSEVIFAGEINY